MRVFLVLEFSEATIRILEKAGYVFEADRAALQDV